MAEKPVVMISSTALDLPEYRQQVVDACHRADMFPKMMEHLSALPVDAIRASLDMVDKADVYVGVFAHRYGYVPEGDDISITQMEYERAVERGIPRLIFLMHGDVPVPLADIDFENKVKLDRFKERLQKEQVVAFFNTPEHLRTLVLQSLTNVRKRIDAAQEGNEQRSGWSLTPRIHHISEIPAPPERYVAHPYTLLRVRGLIGREEQLKLLTDWATGKGALADVRIFNVVAIGGMGKSALTWTWFNEVAPQEMKPLAGWMWWSFYESDATFENFVTRALAYVSARPLSEVKQRPLWERENLLLRFLDREPFFIVLDGLERILVAYAQADATYHLDREGRGDESSNYLERTRGLTVSTGNLLVGKHKLRMTADPRAGRFMQALMQIRASRILVSSRLYPADLQQSTGAPLPRCFGLFLPGLDDRDALALWHAYGAKGASKELLPVFRTFENHPLLLQLLANEVAEFRGAPGDFDAWRIANPAFNPFGLELANVQSHVLAYAMRGLSSAELRTLHVIAGFRMPSSMETLRSLLVRTSITDTYETKPFGTFSELDAALTSLEDRGLLGWDRLSNRYDLHPIVRGVVWTVLDDRSRMDVYGTLRTHFEAIPIPHYLQVESLDDLTPAIELFNTLVRLRLHDEAAQVFQDRLDESLHFRLSATRLRIELLEALSPADPDSPLLHPQLRSFALNSLALAYNLSGRPGDAIPLLRRADELDVQENAQQARGMGLGNLADALRLSGNLREAEAAARTALRVSRSEGTLVVEGASLLQIGLVLIARGQLDEATAAFRRALRILQREGIWYSEGWVNAYLAEVALKQGNAASAGDQARRAWKIAKGFRNEREIIHAARLMGTAAMLQERYILSSEHLEDALLRARAASLVEEELPILISLAEWHRRQGEITDAETILGQIWEGGALEGPYPMFQADAFNLVAQIKRDAQSRREAVTAATNAYMASWCDGPPFAYHWGLEQSRHTLAALGATEPKMPPFNEAQHEPMPDIDIDPPDEFGATETAV